MCMYSERCAKAVDHDDEGRWTVSSPSTLPNSLSFDVCTHIKHSKRETEVAHGLSKLASLAALRKRPQLTTESYGLPRSSHEKLASLIQRFARMSTLHFARRQ